MHRLLLADHEQREFAAPGIVGAPAENRLQRRDALPSVGKVAWALGSAWVWRSERMRTLAAEVCATWVRTFGSAPSVPRDTGGMIEPPISVSFTVYSPGPLRRYSCRSR
jgi:hypothetical protein